MSHLAGKGGDLTCLHYFNSILLAVLSRQNYHSKKKQNPVLGNAVPDSVKKLNGGSA